MNRLRHTLISILVIVIAAVTAAEGGIFISGLLGFEDDADIIASPNREFMVVPEETENGFSGRVKIIDLDPTSGEPLNILYEEILPDTLEYTNGVDPIIANPTRASARDGTPPASMIP